MSQDDRHVVERRHRSARRSPGRRSAGAAACRRGWPIGSSSGGDLAAGPGRPIGEPLLRGAFGRQLRDNLLAGLAVAARRPGRSDRRAGDSRARPDRDGSTFSEQPRHARRACHRLGRRAGPLDLSQQQLAPSSTSSRRAGQPRRSRAGAAAGCEPKHGEEPPQRIRATIRPAPISTARPRPRRSALAARRWRRREADPIASESSDRASRSARRRSRRAPRAHPRRSVSSRFRTPAGSRRRLASPTPSRASRPSGVCGCSISPSSSSMLPRCAAKSTRSPSNRLSTSCSRVVSSLFNAYERRNRSIASPSAPSSSLTSASAARALGSSGLFAERVGNLMFQRVELIVRVDDNRRPAR